MNTISRLRRCPLAAPTAVLALFTGCRDAEPETFEAGISEGETSEGETSEGETSEPDPSSAGDQIDEAAAHDYDAVRPPLLLSWDTDEGLAVRLSNPGDAPLDVELNVIAQALDHRDIVGNLGQLSLQPGQDFVFPIDAGQFPVQSHGVQTRVRASATVVIEGIDIELHSEPARVSFDEAFETFHVDATPHRPATVFEALEAQAKSLAGTARRIGDDGDVAEILSAGSQAPAFPLPPLLVQGPQKVCPTWRTHYSDPNPDQDYLEKAGTQHVSASYAFITIAKAVGGAPWVGSTVWEGYLDEDGCTPKLDLEGDYLFSLHTKHHKALPFQDGDADIEVHYQDSDLEAGEVIPDTPGFASGSFTASLLWPSSPQTGDDNRTTRIAAIVSRALSVDAVPALTSLLYIFADQQCSGGFGGCYGNGSIYIGNNNSGADLTLNRHVVAHEFGHAVQGRTMAANLVLDYNVGSGETTDLCRCDHVTSANGLHCMQSKESISVAFVEGFAHYTAARMFNDPGLCSFSYYKEFLDESGTLTAPPVAMNCAEPVAWLEQYGCDKTDHGSEYDWLTFLWNVTAHENAHTVSAQTVLDLVDEQCSDLWSCSMVWMNWPELEQSVFYSPKLTNKQKDWFIDSAYEFGVAM